MHLERKITDDMYWIGANDRRLALFENVYPIPRGVSYNSYVVLDEKTVLLDTVDHAVSDVFFDGLAHVLAGRRLDYLIVHHMEPDHAATLLETLRRYPEAKVVTTAKALAMIKQFFDFNDNARVRVVKEGDTLETGRHTFTFVMAPMVHWPEVMLSYDAADRILYSADAFGTFGALGGNIFADEYEFAEEWLSDARRYYTNIVGKYGQQVTNVLKKAAKLDIAMICPLHGPVWRKNIGWFVDKYAHWASYEPEERSVVIAYGSIYGHTAQAAELLAAKLAEQGVRNVKVYDVSATHPSYVLSECFRASHLIFASATYNNGIFDSMHILLHDLVTHNLQNRAVALLENGSWAPVSGKLMRSELEQLRGTRFIEPRLTLKSALKEEQREQIEALAVAVAADLKA